MRENGWISQDQLSKALVEPVTLAPDRSLDNSLAPYFVDYVNRVARSEFETSGDVQRIYTDDRSGVTATRRAGTEAANGSPGQDLRGTKRVSRRPRLSRSIRTRATCSQWSADAVTPSRNSIASPTHIVNRVPRSSRSFMQPRLEDGMSPVRTFMDAPREFVYDRTRTYRPANYGGGYSMREVTMRNGL